MKKLMVAVALIACAVSAHAAKVAWGANAALDTEKFASGTMYCMYLASGSTLDWTKLDGLTKFDETSLTSVGFTKKLDSFDYSSSKLNVTRDGGADGVFSPNTTGIATTSAAAYYALISDDGKTIAYTTTAKNIPINATTTSKSLTVAPGQFTVKAAAAPEPTSAMLLLLGVAGMALRRRRV